MELDPLLRELIREASKKFDVQEELMIEIVKEERLRRYRRSGEKRFLDDRLNELLQESLQK